MERISDVSKDSRTIVEALKGDYGVERLGNGVEVLYMGRLVHFSGFFDGSQKVIEIPKLASRVPVLFSGDDFSCVAVAEANSGFVNVPEIAWQKKFVITADCVLNK